MLADCVASHSFGRIRAEKMLTGVCYFNAIQGGGGGGGLPCLLLVPWKGTTGRCYNLIRGGTPFLYFLKNAVLVHSGTCSLR
jgi:hypothetical protein